MGARETALRVLMSCRNNHAWADAALKAQLGRDGLVGPEAALCSRLVYGVVQNQQLLDFYLSAYCSQKPDHLQPPLLEILRLGAYQILYLDRVPDSAAVNTSVELAKLSGRGQASGLVNAVLRKIAQNKDGAAAHPGAGRGEIPLHPVQSSQMAGEAAAGDSRPGGDGSIPGGE